MQHNEEDFDYSGTGATEGSGVTWVQMHTKKKDPLRFAVWKKTMVEGQPLKTMVKDMNRSFAGRLVKLTIDYEQPNTEHKIPGGLRLLLDIKAKDDQLGTENAKGDKMVVFRIAISFRQNIMLPGVLNPLLATDPSWDGYIRLALHRKSDEDPARLYIELTRMAEQGYRPDTKYPWDEVSNKGYKGVPSPRPTGAYDDNGVEILDWAAPRNFWFAEAKQLCEAFNGAPYSGPVGEYTAKGWEFAQPEQKAEPAQESEKTESLAARGLALAIKSLGAGMEWKDAGTKAFEAVKKRQHSKTDIQDLAAALNDHGLKIGMVSGMWVRDEWQPLKTNITEVLPDEPATDDLPF